MPENLSKEIILRPATPEDARQIALLIDIAAGGSEQPQWMEKLSVSQKQRGMGPLDIGEAEVRDPDHYNGYPNIIVAQSGGQLAGIALNHIIAPIDEDALLQLSAINRVYRELKQHRVGSFYIDSLACLPEFQGAGIGSLLINDAMEKARQGEYEHICLLVFDENYGAKRLYRKKGFQEITRLPVPDDPTIPYSGDICLLSQTL